MAIKDQLRDKASRNTKKLLMLAGDFILIPLALWISFSLRLGEFYIPEKEIPYLFILSPIVAFPIFIRFGLYNAIIKYIGFRAIWAVTQAVSLYALIWGVMALLSGVEGILPRSVVIINWIVSILLVGGSRMVARWLFYGVQPFKIVTRAARLAEDRKNIVIYGAGSAGVQLATALSYSTEYRPVGFIDDDRSLRNHYVNGLRVYQFLHIGNLIEKYNVTDILLAMPSISRSRRNEIVKNLEPFRVHVRTLPGIAEMAQGKVKIDDIREVEIDDLLGRDQVEPDQRLLHANISNKVVLVTGAGGSIGSELCRQIIRLSPKTLILYERSEYALYSIEKELYGLLALFGEEGESKISIVAMLSSVCDEQQVYRVCSVFGVQTIYHAAAYKHVPLVEKNPAEAIRNNIFGTLTCAQAAVRAEVESFVLISTDKAVRPTNTMGASKRFAELILQALSKSAQGSTCFTMVRFGNVLGSSGSVVPLFRDQIQKGGPVTVTDPKIIRYFMTIPEAAQLVIQAGAMGKGGEVFVLDMGEPVKILELAKSLIRLSGLEVRDEEHLDGDIEIKFTGLRPGEKLYEELLIGDAVTSTDHALIMKADEEVLSWRDIDEYLKKFQKALDDFDQGEIRKLLLSAVKGYNPQCDVNDAIYQYKKAIHRDKIVDINGNRH